MNKRNRVIRLGGLTLVALGLLLGLNLSTIHAPVITAAGVPDPAITLYGHEYAFEVTPGSPEHVFRFEISNPGNIQIYATWRRPATASQLEFFLDAYDARGRLLHSHQKASNIQIFPTCSSRSYREPHRKVWQTPPMHIRS